MKYLNVAEKNDAAKTIAGQLSNGTARRREGYSVYNKIYDFEAAVKGQKAKMVMTSVSGHLLQLEFLASYRKWNCIDPQSLFEAPVRKACGENYEPIKRTLEREIRSCQGLIIWTDCDREGENIGFEIINVCKAIKPNLCIYRAIFSEITGAAVRRALNNLTAPDKLQSDAVDVRIEMDLRSGAAITRFQTMRFQKLFPQNIADKLISYGSCQIPTLGFVVERYKEIEAFVSKPFWKIKVLHTIDDLTVEFLWARNRLFDKEACEDYYLLVVADPIAKVISVVTKRKNKWRPQPLDTVELEKLGSRKLKMSAKEVMTTAEKLYTKGAISYPRTETNMFSKDINLRNLVEQQTEHGQWGEFAQRVLEWGPNPRNGNKTDQAHPPIHPTKLMTNLQGNEGRVYELVCRHFLACVSKDALGSETIVNIEIAGEKFNATGLVILERNYLDVYIYDKWSAKQIHNYEEGSTFEPTEITMPEGATTAPPLLTEADLIALMEKNGIGTDATHAEHINTIKERGYIGVVDKGFLVPGVIGMGLYEGYDAMQLALAKPVLRAEFENDLKQICLGQKNASSVLSEQIAKYKEAYKQIMEKVTAMDEMMANRINETPVSGRGRQIPRRDGNHSDGEGGGGGGGDDPDDDGNGGGSHTVSNTNFSSIDDTENAGRWYEIFKCPKCKIAKLALKQKKNQSGYFIGCLNYPDCRNVIWLSDECKEIQVLPETCQKCGSDYKLLSMRFVNSYYKTLFHSIEGSESDGRYKTCIRCDQNFRNTFQINLDCVKSTGSIINSGSVNTICSRNNISRENPESNLPIRDSRTKKSEESEKKPKTIAKKVTKSKETKTKVKSKTTPSISASSIRTYFSSGSVNGPQSTSSDIVASELQSIPLDTLFDGQDDDFDLTNVGSSSTTSRNNPLRSDSVQRNFLHSSEDDDLLASIELETRQTYPHQKLNVNTASVSVIPSNQSFNDSLSDIFRREDDDLADYAWGTGSKNNPPKKDTRNRNIRPGCFEPTGQSPLPKRGRLEPTADNFLNRNSYKNTETKNGISTEKTYNTGIVGNTNTYLDSNENYSWGSHQKVNLNRNSTQNMSKSPSENYSWGKNQHTSNVRTQDNISVSSTSAHTNDDYSWGTRQRTTIENSSNDDYSWGSRSNPGPTDSFRNSVKCSGCHQPAKELVVKKEGPNKGRIFYVCSKERPCKYFQWADDVSEQSTEPTVSVGSTSSGNSRNAQNEAHPNCNCNEPARCLTVRKEGPNKGREFYACVSREKSCGFFQWAESTGEGESSINDENWGTSGLQKKTKVTEPKKTTKGVRKCGLCRQEGHSRQKCPRKKDYEY